MTKFQGKKIIRVIQNDPSLMNLTWMINNICNNRCSYCTPSLHGGVGHQYKWENAKKFLELLFERYPKIHCSAVGGEPSISHFFPELVKMFNSSGNTIGVTSNGVKSVEYWKDISKYLNYICFSYHPEFPTRNFKEKVTASSLNTFVTIRLMMLPSMWDHCIEVFNTLKDINICFLEPVRIIDWGGKNREAHIYNQEQLDWFESVEALKPHKRKLYQFYGIKEPVNLSSKFQFDDKSIVPSTKANPVEFINAGMTNFKGYACEIGLKSLFVQTDGKIYLGNCSVGGCIGNINDYANIKWTTHPVICNKDLCHCSTDVNVSKWIRNYNEYIK